MALHHLLDVYLPLSGHHRYRFPALQVPHPRPHTARPPHAEAVQPQKDVRPGWRRDKAVNLYPAPLHQPLTPPFLPCYRPYRGFAGSPGHRRPQPPGGPSPGPARRVGLREHLPAVPAAEAALQYRHPHLLSPELGVPFALDVPLVHLPSRALAPGTDRLVVPILRHDLNPLASLLDGQHPQSRQPPTERDRVVLHLASFL